MAFRLIESILVGDDPNTQKWRLWCFSLSHRIVFEQPAAFLPAKKIRWKDQWKEMKKTRNRGRVSKLVAQPFFSQGSPHIWFDAFCILHALYFRGQTLNTTRHLLYESYQCVCVRACVCFTYTHLLRNNIANFVVEYIKRAQNNPFQTARKNRMKRRENQCRWILSLSLHKVTVSSDEVSSSSDCENRTLDWNLLTSKFWGRSWCNWKPKNDMPVLGLAGCHWRKWKLVQVRRLASQSVSPDQMGVFVGSGPKWSAATPCLIKSLEVLHLFRWSTHTPRCREAVLATEVPTMKWKWRRREMRMRWRWQWDESYLTRTQRGERKRRGKEQTPTHET